MFWRQSCARFACLPPSPLSPMQVSSDTVSRVLASPAVAAVLPRAAALMAATDSAHDVQHCLRVLATGVALGDACGADVEVIALAALLHDSGNLPKNHPDAASSSERSAGVAERVLAEEDVLLSPARMDLLRDAIVCHSFSRGLTPTTLEGRVFQDADRLDAVGAVGIARCFMVTGSMGRSMYHPEDPFHDDAARPLDDKEYAVDHFYRKLLLLKDSMQTDVGRAEAARRTAVMQSFLDNLQVETASPLLLALQKKLPQKE